MYPVIQLFLLTYPTILNTVNVREIWGCIIDVSACQATESKVEVCPLDV